MTHIRWMRASSRPTGLNANVCLSVLALTDTWSRLFLCPPSIIHAYPPWTETRSIKCDFICCCDCHGWIKLIITQVQLLEFCSSVLLQICYRNLSHLYFPSHLSRNHHRSQSCATNKLIPFVLNVLKSRKTTWHKEDDVMGLYGVIWGLSPFISSVQYSKFCYLLI